VQAAADRVRAWRDDPRVFVREVFGVTPDAWQDDVLGEFPRRPRIALKACAGPGKTALLSWLCWNFMLTRPHPKIAATAISGENLRDNLWTEMAKWRERSPIVKSAFEWQAERIFARDHPQTWWMSARRWSKSATAEQQGNTLRGLHDDYVMAVVDESGGIPEAVMATVENIGSSAVEWHVVQAGNPTHLEGPLYTACTKERDLWHVVEITADPDDPKRTPRVSVQWARDQIQIHGRDNPWVLVNVFGRFPPSSLNSLIGPDEVNEAMQRRYREDRYAQSAKILGVDVGREGDDPSVMISRQGVVAFEPQVMRNFDSIQGAGVVARKWADWRADACFVDGTGGFGSGWVDQLRALNYSPVGVHFAGKPNDPRYFNKRAEMWFEAVRWIKEGGALFPSPELVAELTAPTYAFKGDQLILEDKAQVKARIGRSLDRADALALTFAQPVAAPAAREMLQAIGAAQRPREYDPFAALG
jgi:hypothetical protein